MKLCDLMPRYVMEYDVTPLEELESDYYANKELWVDINGDEHKISEMSTDYIVNCLKLINRKKLNATFMSHIVIFIDELKHRGIDIEIIEI